MGKNVATKEKKEVVNPIGVTEEETIEEKDEVSVPLHDESDDFSPEDAVDLDDEELNPFGDKWEM